MADNYVRTKEHKRKMSEILKGRKVTWGDKISEGKSGKSIDLSNRRSYRGSVLFVMTKDTCKSID